MRRSVPLAGAIALLLSRRAIAQTAQEGEPAPATSAVPTPASTQPTSSSTPPPTPALTTVTALDAAPTTEHPSRSSLIGDVGLMSAFREYGDIPVWVGGLSLSVGGAVSWANLSAGTHYLFGKTPEGLTVAEIQGRFDVDFRLGTSWAAGICVGLSHLEFERKTSNETIVSVEPMGALRIGYYSGTPGLYVRIAGDVQALFITGTTLEAGLSF